MNIFLGSIYPEPLLKELMARKQFVDYPANVFQLSLLKGLDEHLLDLRVISSPVIKSSYSSVKDICGSCKFSHKGTDDKEDLYIGTVPIPGIQMLTELWRVYKTVKSSFKKKDETNNLIVYALHSPFLLAATLLRKRITCSCVVVPDLPEFMSGGNVWRRLFKKIDRSVINFCLKRLDSYVLLSPYMRERLPIKDKPWVLMEGIYDTSSIPQNIEKETERVILYTGNLSRRYGISELLEAFHQIKKDNYRLWICGRGDAEEDIVNLSKEDSRIKFFGVVTHDEVLTLQQKASVLVNPRSSEGEYTKYSFPSKTMEYLASGTPTVMCHLPAIPEEYDKYIYYITDESTAGIRAKLLEVCDKNDDELAAFGKRAADFIKNEKNASVQAKKIIDLMNK